MRQKVCPRCNQPSYSSAELTQWLCPYCERDLTDIEATPPELAPRVAKTPSFCLWYVQIEGIAGKYPLLGVQYAREGEELMALVIDNEGAIAAIPAKHCRLLGARPQE